MCKSVAFATCTAFIPCFNNLINRNIKRLEIIKAFINDDAFSDLHPSIIKSFLVATQSLNGIEEERAYADNLLSQKLV